MLYSITAPDRFNERIIIVAPAPLIQAAAHAGEVEIISRHIALMLLRASRELKPAERPRPIPMKIGGYCLPIALPAVLAQARPSASATAQVRRRLAA